MLPLAPPAGSWGEDQGKRKLFRGKALVSTVGPGPGHSEVFDLPPFSFLPPSGPAAGGRSTDPSCTAAAAAPAAPAGPRAGRQAAGGDRAQALRVQGDQGAPPPRPGPLQAGEHAHPPQLAAGARATQIGHPALSSAAHRPLGHCHLMRVGGRGTKTWERGGALWETSLERETLEGPGEREPGRTPALLPNLRRQGVYQAYRAWGTSSTPRNLEEEVLLEFESETLALLSPLSVTDPLLRGQRPSQGEHGGAGKG